MSNGSRRRPASKATGCGSATITACWWKSASRKNPRPTRSHRSRRIQRLRACRARAIGATRRPTRPRRLAHLALYTADVGRAIGFYRDVLGLRLSDSSEGNVAFMHGPHGSDHHMVAFARSGGAGLHHCSWDVGAVQEIGLGAMQMAGKGYTAGWGLGRHVLGSNYFHYVRDPWGSYSEYSADMDYIPADHDWRSGDHPGEDSFFLWGPNPPEDFVRNYEIET
jgi:catechol 2,3-dioxygenase-like lactoylglutathione lyase family enzyme